MSVKQNMEQNQSESTTPPKTSSLAIACFVLGLGGSLFVLFPVAGLVLGIIALIKIGRSKGQLKGKGFAIAGIIISILFIILYLMLIFYAEEIVVYVMRGCFY